MDALPWLRKTMQGWSLQIHAQPGAAHSEIIGLHGHALKVRVAAPPVEGKANAALVSLIAQRLAVPRRCVQVGAGASGRAKRVDVAADELSAEVIVKRLLG